MNTNSMNNRPQIHSAKKPCCKVCKDAGKSENEYSTHYVKDLNGQVTCPTLLNQECRFCHRKGHTISHCSELAKRKEKESRQYEKPPLSPPKKEVKKSNVFAYLEMNSDESEEEDEQEEFPSLNGSKNETARAVKMTSRNIISYAAAAKTIIKPKVKSQKVWPALAPGQKKSWTQVCDEDSSDDEDEEDKAEYFEDPFEDNVSSLAEDNSAW